MELVDDEDVDTIAALYCGTRSNQNAPIQLFAELAGVEATEDPTPLGEEMELKSRVWSESTTHGIDIDLNTAPETDVVGDDVYHSSDLSDHEVNSESDPNVDEVSDDIDDEGINEDGNVNASLVGNQIHRIVIHNNPGEHMSRIDPDAVHVAEFLEYPEILPAHRMAVYSDPEELFMGQRFEKVGRRLQLADTSYIYPEVLDVGDAEICWASHMHFNTDFDASYNELQGWIAAMREYMLETVIEL
ncbi:hypothetical protein GOBAR_AA16004 [Gossypium barbadense]|uniref:Uncharacterized protein n=1 Tax=Gossypium barbadense TaxID=3634 RepID=A0A2P5XMS1_GOSBA|nr:hypothetical protein GOBAR_AA16004 [Gossypium barbadense]